MFVRFLYFRRADSRHSSSRGSSGGATRQLDTLPTNFLPQAYMPMKQVHAPLDIKRLSLAAPQKRDGCRHFYNQQRPAQDPDVQEHVNEQYSIEHPSTRNMSHADKCTSTPTQKALTLAEMQSKRVFLPRDSRRQRKGQRKRVQQAARLAC
eukprot:6184662-Pleurochrysis_carterae.AAC.1